jgi:hypothetical protein
MSKDNNEPAIVTQWTEQHEKILAEWADKAMCYRWLHSRSENKYLYLTRIFTIPVIILSTLTGTANFAIERIPEEYQSVVQISIGSLNILAGIITTVQQFLKINELNESHRVASISWGKFYRNLKTELLKSPQERCDVNYLVKTSKEEFDRLVETSPAIEEFAVKQFNKRFNKTITEPISVPEICDSLRPTSAIIFRVPIEDTESQKVMEIIKKKQDVINKETHIEDFINKFKSEYLRVPTPAEIIENMEDQVSGDIINNFMTKKKMNKKRSSIVN